MEKKRVPDQVPAENPSCWRARMAEAIAAAADAARIGVKGLYLFGSAKNGTARPGSDIILFVHFAGNDSMRRDLLAWLEG